MSRFKPGTSGNPAGRPPGIGTAEPLRAAIREHVPAIITAMVEQAKAGDVQAARLLLERAIPAVKPIAEPVRVDMVGDTLTDKAASILDTVSRGELSPADAKLLLDGLAGVAKITEIDELARRVSALEGKQP